MYHRGLALGKREKEQTHLLSRRRDPPRYQQGSAGRRRRVKNTGPDRPGPVSRPTAPSRLESQRVCLPRFQEFDQNGKIVHMPCCLSYIPLN
ncbi:hypothetical protein Taro_048344 [Colocasia esculenta]|uniref:Uncharacterized protein n=1 Tax=Colocasia esculenta TaxID=4460 RepID=A0A843WY50_COLES|nr:hypothetical protein [Colocasia esculenta]